MLETLLIVLVAVLLDRRLGEPKRFHPLVGFGNLASRYEQRFNRPDNPALVLGLLGVLLLCGGIAALFSLAYLTPFTLILEALILYLASRSPRCFGRPCCCHIFI